MVPGDTVTVAALAGAAPELAVHTNGAAPLDDRVAVWPEQIVVNDGVIVIAGVVDIDTVATAVDVQVPAPANTVYVVVVVGETVTLATLAGFAPLLAVHAKGPEPLAFKTTLCPEHIVEKGGVIVTVGKALTLTVITVELTHAPTVLVTV